MQYYFPRLEFYACESSLMKDFGNSGVMFSQGYTRFSFLLLLNDVLSKLNFAGNTV